jgi:O-antigen ligase
MNPVSGSSNGQRAGKSPRFSSAGLRPTISVRDANNEAVWRILRTVVYGLLLIRASCDPVFTVLGAGDGSMGLGAILNVVAIAVTLLLVAKAPSTAPFPVIGIWGPFLLIVFAATCYAPDFTAASRLAFVFLSYWSFFIIPFLIWRAPGDLSRFLMLVVASSIVPSLYALVDIAQGASNMADFRLFSTFSHPNIYAFYLVLLIGLALYVRSSRIIQVTPTVRRLMTLYIPYLIVLLMLTKARSAWIACGLILVVYALRIDRKFLFGLLLIPMLAIADPSAVDRLTEVTGTTEFDSFKQLNETNRLNSYVWRQALWESAIPQIFEKPLLGHGLESFKPSTPSFFALVGPLGIDGHNLYLQVGYEMGAAGFLALLWLLGSVAGQILKGRRRDPPGVLIILGIWVGYVLECYSDNMHFYLSFNWYFWFVMGTICAWVYNEVAASRREIAAPPRHQFASGFKARAVAPERAASPHVFFKRAFGGGLPAWPHPNRASTPPSD